MKRENLLKQALESSTLPEEIKSSILHDVKTLSAEEFELRYNKVGANKP